MATIKGNKKNNKLKGKGGNDKILGLAGDDRLKGKGGDDKLLGGTGNDVLDGGAGNDVMKGGAGDDVMEAGEGADYFVGGAGIDTVSFAKQGFGVSIELLTMTSTFDGLQDAFSGIENIDGTAFGDAIEGDGAANHFRGFSGKDKLEGGGGNDILDGGEGDDVLEGGTGADSLIGGNGFDSVSYVGEASAVNVYLHGAANGGAAAGDTLSSIEQVSGSIHSDVIQGNDLANWLYGMRGADTISGRGGNDTIDGGDGADLIDGGTGDDLIFAADETTPSKDIIVGGANKDTVDYRGANGGVSVDLTANSSGGAAAGDSYSAVENVNGYYYNDTLRPGAGGTAFGDRGEDAIHDSTGTEILRGGRDADQLSDIGFGEDGKRDIFALESYGDGSFDTVSGFTSAGANQDLFWLPETMFGALGANAAGVLAAGYFINAASNHTPTAAHAQLIYQGNTHEVWFDADGTGSGAAVKVAVLNAGPASLANAHFLLVDA